MKLRSLLLFLLFINSASLLNAQDLLSTLGNDNEKSHDLTIATFKTTRLVNFHTLETVGPKTLDFRISHRFGAINSKGYNAWGIDGPVNIRLSLEYSPDGRFMFGIGRSSYQKMVDGFLKWKLLRQRDDNSMPLTVTLFAGMYRNALKNQVINGYDLFEHETSRLSYNFQILMGRKFTPSFSFQIAPWFVHYNMVTAISDKNDMYGISGMFRLKFSKRSAITAEYAYRMNKYSNAKNYDSMGIGYEIETGGHVFQVHLTNSFGLDENQFLPFTDSKWNDAGIRLGFNVSRVFTL
jgi:hypothetical protein